MALAVNGADATPDALVATVIVAVLFENPRRTRPGGERHIDPDTGLLPASSTVTASVRERRVDGRRLRRRAGIRRHRRRRPVFVSEKLTVVSPVPPPSPCTDRRRGIGGERRSGDPDALVATVIVVVLFENTPEAPAPGAVNVTFTPDTGLLPASFTVTASAFAKAVLMVADCGVVPAFAVIELAPPAVFVSEKLTVVSPVAAAVTV